MTAAATMNRTIGSHGWPISDNTVPSCFASCLIEGPSTKHRPCLNPQTSAPTSQLGLMSSQMDKSAAGARAVY